MAYRIKSVLSLADPADVLVSTDSEEYAEIAGAFGAFIPYLRPASLASDHASSVDVVLHAMNWALSQGRQYEYIGLLQPTSPFVKSSTLLQACDNIAEDEAAQSIVAVKEARPGTFYVQENSKYLSVLTERFKTMKTLRRQDLKTEITPCGGLYIVKWDTFQKEKTFYPEKTRALPVSDIEAVDIDEPIDWLWAEFLLENNFVNMSDLCSL